MNNSERKIIIILLLFILSLSCILVYKIKTEPKYDEKLYSEIYTEYDELFEYNQGPIEEYALSTTRENKIENKIENKAYSKVIDDEYDSKIVGKISIPQINIEYPILNETSTEYLKIAPTKYMGPEVNEVGNLCVVGHNYKSGKFFGRLSKLNIGDGVFLTSNTGNYMVYSVYDKYEVSEDDLTCTSQETNGSIELTLITCTKKRDNRLVVKCKAIT